MILRTTAAAGIIILGLTLLFHDSNNMNKPVQPEKLNTFIQEAGIENPNVVKMSDSKYYVFSSGNNTVYVYEGNENSRTTKSIPRDGIVFGGLEKGSFGLIIKNRNVLKNAYQYNLIIDGESVSYKYNKEKYLVVKDSRVWNPNPEVTIVFSDKEGKELLKEKF